MLPESAFSKPASILMVDFVDERSNALDVDSHFVPVAKNDPRLPHHTNARASSCEDDGAFLNRRTLRQERNRLGDIENHFTSKGVIRQSLEEGGT